MAQVNPNRRRVSFSLKALLLGVLAVSLACAWLGWRLRKAERQQQAVAEIERLGGKVFYDHQMAGMEPNGPPWLRDWLGEHVFDRVVRVELGGIEGLADISLLGDWDDLQFVFLHFTDVSDLAPLADKPKLEFISLSHTRVEEIDALRGSPRLEGVDLSRTSVRDLGPLAGRPLKRLWLRGTPVDDLSGLVVDELVVLDLDKTGVTDITPLASATNLTELSLSRTEVVDVTPLLGLRRLTSLDLKWTKISAESVQALRKAFPACEIMGP